MNQITLHSRDGRWLLPVFLTAIVLLIPACDRSRPAETVPLTVDSQLFQVDFAIRYDGQKPDIHLATLKVSAGATVWNALETAAGQCGFRVASTGNGTMLFVSAIDGVTNQGALGNNWTYRVNGELGNCSAGALELSPGDRIEWKMGDYPVK